MTITLDLPDTLERQLRTEAARNGVSLGRQIVRQLAVLKPPVGTSAPLSEAELLKKINLDLGIAPAVWERYDGLRRRLRRGILTETEHNELLTLIEVVENANVERLHCLIALSQLRGVSLEKTMADLGIFPRQMDDDDDE